MHHVAIFVKPLHQVPQNSWVMDVHSPSHISIKGVLTHPHVKTKILRRYQLGSTARRLNGSTKSAAHEGCARIRDQISRVLQGNLLHPKKKSDVRRSMMLHRPASCVIFSVKPSKFGNIYIYVIICLSNCISVNYTFSWTANSDSNCSSHLGDRRNMSGARWAETPTGSPNRPWKPTPLECEQIPWVCPTNWTSPNHPQSIALKWYQIPSGNFSHSY